MILNVWCGPRTVSTALMYSWRQRPDTRVFDEPFYGIYLRRTDPGHPGRDQILAAMPDDVDAVVARIRTEGDEPVRFVKNIGHHLDALPDSVLEEFTNVVLVREPARVIASLDATLHADFPVTITGLPQQVRVVEHELAAGRTPIVIDAGDLLAEPTALLTALCRAVDLEFDVAMLHWPAGPKPEDGVWAKHWYQAVHRSTGFVDPPAGTVELSEPQQRLLEECRPLYELLLAHRLAVD
jgi:Sulfotransferase domain